MVGAKIQEILTKKGLTQDDLAKGIGMSLGQVNRIINGKAAPTLTSLEKILNFLTKDHKVYFVELERESHGDLSEKIRKYEGLFWAREARNETEGCLVLVCTKKATYAKLGGNAVKSIYYPAFPEQWKW